MSLALGLALLALAGLCGCFSPESKTESKISHQIATFRVFLEGRQDASSQAQGVSVGRESPMKFNIEKEAFLNEAYVKEASVVDEPGGFALRIQFNREGGLTLEEYTVNNRGKHLVLMSQFMDPVTLTNNMQRWLAAPRITQRITEGVLVFTPDASREECENIAHGLMNVKRKRESLSILRD